MTASKAGAKASSRMRRGGAASNLRLVAFVVIMLCGSALAGAQDTHYWSIQYGPVGQLVGGQLIGGVERPLGHLLQPGGAGAAERVVLPLVHRVLPIGEPLHGARAGLAVFDASSSHFGAAPSLLAGVLPRWLGQDTHLAWSFLTRQNLDVRLGQRVTTRARRRRGARPSRTSTRTPRRCGPASPPRTPSPTPWASGSPGTGSTGARGCATSSASRRWRRTAASRDGPRASPTSSTRTTAPWPSSAWPGRPRDWKAGLSDHDPQPRRVGQRQDRLHALPRRASTRTRTGSSDPPDPGHGNRGGPGQPLPIVLGGGGRGCHGPRARTRLYASAEWYAPVARYTVIEAPRR